MDAQAKPKVLAVDDRPENLFVMRHILGRMNIELIEASTGKEALTHALHHKLDLIMLDIQLPDMSGYEVAKLLRDRQATTKVPVIFVTANDKNKELISKGYAAGATDYLFKPLDPDLLRKKVTAALNGRVEKAK